MKRKLNLTLETQSSDPKIPSNRGLFVTFEGIEGSGKSTLSRSVSEELIKRGLTVQQTFEPGDTNIGKELRPLLLNDTLGVRASSLLFAADRAHHVENVIIPALAEDKIVLCDRFETSSVVYQGIWRQLGAENVRSLSRFSSQGLIPDMIIFCKIEPSIAAARRDSHPDQLDKAATCDAEIIAEGFANEADKDPSRFLVINADMSIEKLTKIVADEVEQRYNKREVNIRENNERGQLILISGPSGAGKNSVLNELINQNNSNSRWYSVSVTTRRARLGEVNGVDYNFIDDEKFDKLLEEGKLLEHAQFSGARYGTLSEPIEKQRKKGIDVIALVELSGVRQIKAVIPEALVIFLIPPSPQELEQRLLARGTESRQEMSNRLATAAQEMITGPQLADYVICNDNVKTAAARIDRIIER
jgi:guanylate kinase/dTMP kinase